MSGVPGFFGNGPDIDEVPEEAIEAATLKLEGKALRGELVYTVAELVEALVNANDALHWTIESRMPGLNMDERKAMDHLAAIAGYLSRRHAELVEDLMRKR